MTIHCQGICCVTCDSQHLQVSFCGRGCIWRCSQSEPWTCFTDHFSSVGPGPTDELTLKLYERYNLRHNELRSFVNSLDNLVTGIYIYYAAVAHPERLVYSILPLKVTGFFQKLWLQVNRLRQALVKYLQSLISDPMQLSLSKRERLLNALYQKFEPLNHALAEVCQIMLHLVISDVVDNPEERSKLEMHKIAPVPVLTKFEECLGRWESYVCWFLGETTAESGAEVERLLERLQVANEKMYSKAGLMEFEILTDLNRKYDAGQETEDALSNSATPVEYNHRTLQPVRLFRLALKFHGLLHFSKHEPQFWLNQLAKEIYGFDPEKKYYGELSIPIETVKLFDLADIPYLLPESAKTFKFMSSMDPTTKFSEEFEKAVKLNSPLHMLFKNGGIICYNKSDRIVSISAFGRGNDIFWSLPQEWTKPVNQNQVARGSYMGIMSQTIKFNFDVIDRSKNEYEHTDLLIQGEEGGTALGFYRIFPWFSAETHRVNIYSELVQKLAYVGRNHVIEWEELASTEFAYDLFHENYDFEHVEVQRNPLRPPNQMKMISTAHNPKVYTSIPSQGGSIP